MDACGDIENPSATSNPLIYNDCYGVTSKIEEAVGDTVEVEIGYPRDSHPNKLGKHVLPACFRCRVR